MKRVLAAAALLGACVSDHYECETDRDCDLGAAGRCEVDHHCTAYDPACDTTRRYTAHAGELSNACYEPAIADFNPCASGQPPGSRDDACAALVCDKLASCCDTGWSAACVQRAQLDCMDVRCDLQVAITATKGATTDLYLLGSDGSGIDASQPTGLDALVSYLAPAPGTTGPRLAGLADNGATLVIGTTRIALSPGVDYQSAASVDFDRDLRDTVALGWQDTDAGTTGLEIVKVATSERRSIATETAFQLATWGDQDNDAFPDVIAGFNARYTFLESKDDADHRRTLKPAGANSVTAGQGGVPQLRSFDWTDYDGDGVLDLIVFGNAVMVHRGLAPVTDIPTFRIDCDPPYLVTGGNQCGDFDTIQFVGAAVAQRDGTAELVIGNDLGRNLYRVVIRHTDGDDQVEVTPMVFSAPCVGTTCVPMRAVIARDVDGDHILDVIALDADLHVFFTLSGTDPSGLMLSAAQPITGGASDYTLIRTSITGAPR